MTLRFEGNHVLSVATGEVMGRVKAFDDGVARFAGGEPLCGEPVPYLTADELRAVASQLDGRVAIIDKIQGVGIVRYCPGETFKRGFGPVDNFTIAKEIAQQVRPGAVLVLPDTRNNGTYLWDFTIVGGDPAQVSVERASDFDTERPLIVCLCGSTKFKEAFEAAQASETEAGRIVLTVGRFGHRDGLDMDGELKVKLDELHKRKIDLADEVLVINVRDYIGESTRKEIEYAKQHGKAVRYLEPTFRGDGPSVSTAPDWMVSFDPASMTDTQREQYEVTDTGDEASYSMRTLFKVKCKRCGRTLHVGTTHPPAYMDGHGCEGGPHLERRDVE
jgi:hypothetical protein